MSDKGESANVSPDSLSRPSETDLPQSREIADEGDPLSSSAQNRIEESIKDQFKGIRKILADTYFGGALKQYPELSEGVNIPAFSEEAQVHIIAAVRKAEDFLDALLDEEPANKLSSDLQFLATKPFYDFHNSFESVRPNVLDTIRHRGQFFQKEDGKIYLSIHTTLYQSTWSGRLEGKPRQLSQEEATFVSVHEISHAKVKLQVIEGDDGSQITRSGFSEIIQKQDGTEEEKGLTFNEVSTDLIAAIGLSRDAHSFKELANYVLETRQDFRDEKYRNDILVEFCRFMDFSFPSFDKGRKIFVETYAQCNLKKLLASIREELQPRVSRARDMSLWYGIGASGEFMTGIEERIIRNEDTSVAFQLKNVNDAMKSEFST